MCDVGFFFLHTKWKWNARREGERAGEATESLIWNKKTRISENRCKMPSCKWCQRLNCNQKMRKIHHEEQFNLAKNLTTGIRGQMYTQFSKQKPPKLWTQAIGKWKAGFTDRTQNRRTIVCRNTISFAAASYILQSFIAPCSGGRTE